MRRAALLALASTLLSCAPGAERGPDRFRMEPANRGPERYSAWFADSDGSILYFGLSAFWSASWSAGGDSLADLKLPGDQLIGRFDLAREQYLPPLRVRGLESGVHSSLWDVLVHSNGRIYFTTFFEEAGSVQRDGSDLQLFSEAGLGLAELAEGPEGQVYATRYASDPRERGAETYASVVVLTPRGELERDLRLPSTPERFPAAKSLAVDPESGEIWLNTDTFLSGGEILHETFRLAPDGAVLERRRAPELLFMRFDRSGLGWFAESVRGLLRVRLLERGREIATLDLGARPESDFVQDIHFAPDGSALLARWSGVVHELRWRNARLERRDLQDPGSRTCTATGGPALLYSAIPHRGRVYATIHCGATISRLTATGGRIAVLPSSCRPEQLPVN